MDRLKYEIVTLKNGEQYFVLEELFFEYEVYYLALNLNDENDVKIFVQEVVNGKNALTKVEDERVLKSVSPLFEEKVRNKIMSLN